MLQCVTNFHPDAFSSGRRGEAHVQQLSCNPTPIQIIYMYSKGILQFSCVQLKTLGSHFGVTNFRIALWLCITLHCWPSCTPVLAYTWWSRLELLGTSVERHALALTVLFSFPDCSVNKTTVHLHYSCSALMWDLQHCYAGTRCWKSKHVSWRLCKACVSHTWCVWLGRSDLWLQEVTTIRCNVRPYQPVVSSTIARWVKTILTKSGAFKDCLGVPVNLHHLSTTDDSFHNPWARFKVD